MLISLVFTFFLQVSSPELIREALITKQDFFSGRPKLVRIDPYVLFQEDEVALGKTPAWKKTLITSMRM